MRFEIVVAPQPLQTEIPAPPVEAANTRLRPVLPPPHRPPRELLDIFLDGANVTARVRESHGAFVLRDFALALVELAPCSFGKAVVRFYDEPWELCVERFGATAFLSVYRTGLDPIVAVYDRAVPFRDLASAARAAIERLLDEGGPTRHVPRAHPHERAGRVSPVRSLAGSKSPTDPGKTGESTADARGEGQRADGALRADDSDREAASQGRQDFCRAELAAALEPLRAIAVTAGKSQGPDFDLPVPEPVPVVVEPQRDAPLSFGAEFAMRERSLRRKGRPSRAGVPTRVTSDDEGVERADLHALLFRGRVRAEIRGRTVDLGECHPVLVAERLVELARRAFDAWEHGLPLHARGEAAGVLVGVRVSTEGELALSLGGTQGGARRAIHTFPALGVADVLEAALAFGRSLVRAILRRDRTQGDNLRLAALRRVLREGSLDLRAASQTDARINPTPEPYRAFAVALDQARTACAPPAPAALSATRLRYATRWRAVVPGIDLRSTYLCGDRLIVGGAAEMWALDRTDGRVLWRVDVTRGTSLVTPAGIARLAPDGALRVHDFGGGEVTLSTRIAPRVGGPVTGTVVHLPGLPKLLIATEGDHHLVAVDLTSGEPRWRWSWGGVRGNGRGSSPRAPRMKRVGRLLYLTCGESALTAMDVMSGAVVWRVRDRLRFYTPPAVVHDSLYVVAGGAHGMARLYCFDAFSGDVRWSTPVASASAAGSPVSPLTVEGAPLIASGAVAVAVRSPRFQGGLALAAFRKDDGRPVANRPRVLTPSGTSWLAVDEAFIGNTPTGELVAVDSETGELRWRQVLSARPLEADVPRRLEPVLRCGALFVPHTDVAVVRPRDGALLGTIAPAQAIPDLLRVDERCDVFVAEESGHLVAFGALPRLSLV